jgi:hypothetical protein
MLSVVTLENPTRLRSGVDKAVFCMFMLLLIGADMQNINPPFDAYLSALI